nr:MAG TPA: hypothetical protein [Caudoviricetes sp.]
MKTTALQSPPEWVNYKYYELQSTCKSRTLQYKSHGPLYYLKEGAEVGLGVAVIYLIVALAALL